MKPKARERQEKALAKIKRKAYIAGKVNPSPNEFRQSKSVIRNYNGLFETGQDETADQIKDAVSFTNMPMGLFYPVVLKSRLDSN